MPNEVASVVPRLFALYAGQFAFAVPHHHVYIFARSSYVLEYFVPQLTR
jgi:hypothetical protein